MAPRRTPRLPRPDTGRDPALTEQNGGARPPTAPSPAVGTTSLWRAQAPRQIDVLAQVSQLPLPATVPHGAPPVRRHRR